MKPALSFIEVIISILLISVSVGALYKIETNSDSLITNLPKNQKIDNMISCVEISNSDKNFYFTDENNIKNDDIRRYLKEVKINIKQEILPVQTKLDNKVISNFGLTRISIDKEEKTLIRVLP